MAKTEIRYCPQCYLSRRFVDGVCAVCEYVIPGWGETTVIYDPPIRYEAGKGTIGYPCGFADSMGVTDQVMEIFEKAFPENMPMKRINTGWLATQFPEAFRDKTE